MSHQTDEVRGEYIVETFEKGPIYPNPVGTWTGGWREDDYYTAAVSKWQGANRDLKKFAEYAAQVSGHRTAALAADIRRSVDTVENYRNAWLLYQRLIRAELIAPSELARMWEVADISIWVKATQLQKRLDLRLLTIQDYISAAVDGGMTREQFGAAVDDKENLTPPWLRRLRRVVALLIGGREDWMTEMPIEKRARYTAAADRFAAELQTIAESEDE